MSAISNFLSFLRSAIYAIDVRDGIADAIEQCYNDVNNPTLKTEALEAALQTKIDEGEMAALTIGDHTITAAKLANGVIPAADATLTETGKPADAAETGRQIGLIKAELDAIEPGLSNDAKVALLNCFAHVKWSDGHGQDYYNALEEALYNGAIPVNPFESAEYDFGGWGFSRSSETSTGYLVNRNELTKRAGCVVAIHCTSGRLVAKPGYLVTLYPLTSNRMETATVKGQQKQVYVDVIYTESSQYISDTSLDIPAGTQYVCLTLRKEDDSNFTQNEIDNLYGTVFEYEEVTV